MQLLALSFRFDLERLSDSELAARFDRVAAEREAVVLPPWPAARNRSERTWLRHPRIYRLHYVLDKAGALDLPSLGLVFAAFLGSSRFRRWALDSAEAQAYLLNYELLDLMDEMKRRAEVRRKVRA